MNVSIHAATCAAWPESERPGELPRPAGLEPGVWRRFSRLSRLAAGVLSPLLDAAGGALDRAEAPLYFGTGLGEFSSTYTFLKSLIQRGPAGASPLAFQNSVHNAAAGHLSIAFGLTGPSETLCAGDHTTLRTFERAMAGVLATSAPALVVLADDLGDDAAAGWRLAAERQGWQGAVLAEGAAAFLIGPSGAGGAPLTLHDHGAAPFDRRAGAFCTADAQVLAQAFRARRAVQVGLTGGPGLALEFPG